MNYNLLKDEMLKQKISYDEMAMFLNMSVSTFYRKMNRQTAPFSIKDADLIKQKLRLSTRKAAVIFFGK